MQKTKVLSTSDPSQQILAVAAGEAQFTSLGLEERAIAHAIIDGRIAERAATVSFGEVARKPGQVTVSIDDDGNIVEIAPDGARQIPSGE